MNFSIGVVIVTYNRLEKLKKTLRLFAEQTCLPAYITVVNNASTDGTAEYLQHWQMASASFQKNVLTMPENLGGSGGFYEGMKYAQDANADWIWVSDDDAFPEQDTLEQAQKWLQHHAEEAPSIAAICAEVLNHDELALDHRRRLERGLYTFRESAVPAVEYKQEFFPIDLFSYVGAILNRDKLRATGLPRKDFFIYYDDTEHSIRMRQTGCIYCLPAVRVHHDTAPLATTTTTNIPHMQWYYDQPSWKTYYGIRNRLITIREHGSMLAAMRSAMKPTLQYLLGTMLGRNQTKNHLLRDAISDAMHGRAGKNNRYLPGQEMY